MVTTSWGEALDADAVLQEYPRPQLVRDSHLNLNGTWDFAIVPRTRPGRPEFTERILVPFPPESPLSGVERVLTPDEYAWYRRTFTLPDGFCRGRVILHLGAVDQRCEVWIDGSPAGGHEGGMLPCSFDVTDLLHRDEHELVVRVEDDTDRSDRSRGTQRLQPGGTGTSPMSGIWQTVWIESVPEQHVRAIEYRPLLDRDEVEVLVRASEPGTAQVTVTAAGAMIAREDVPVDEPVRIGVPGARRWSPADPFLHDVEVTLGDDHVRSYVGMREIRVARDETGRARVVLNGEPVLVKGVLHRGLWPDGLHTAPSDAALRHDVELARRLGFNTLRVHGTVEPLRWYHHCDRLGLMVWQDMVAGGDTPSRLVTGASALARVSVDDGRHRRFGRQDAAGRERFLAEVDATVRLLRGAPSVVAWVPFQEGQGQFDALDVTERIRALDPTRLVDHASGWYDQGGGDVLSRHVTHGSVRVPEAGPDDARVLALTEVAGPSHEVPGHTWSARSRGRSHIRHRGRLQLALQRLLRVEVADAVADGVGVAILAQLTDVEQMTDGLQTYDRAVLKVDEDAVRSWNAALDEEFRRSMGAAPRAIAVAERELTTPAHLTLPDGRLNPEAIGWSRTPLVRTDGIGGLRGLGRNKRWEYWAVTTPSHVLGIVVSDLDYAGVTGLYLLDRATGEELVVDQVLPPGQVQLPGTIGEGRVHARTKALLLRADEVPSGTRLRGRGDRVGFDIVAHLGDEHEMLGVVVPWSDRRFQYTVKDVGRQATGTIWIDGVAHDVSGPDAFATLDHGRGRWPHDVRWNWGAGAATVAGQRVALQLGGTWTDRTGSTENAIFLGPRLHKIEQELIWEHDVDHPEAPWRVTGEGVELGFEPFHVRRADMELGPLGSHTMQAFGQWSGVVSLEGRRVTFDGLTGWAEDVHNRW